MTIPKFIIAVISGRKKRLDRTSGAYLGMPAVFIFIKQQYGKMLGAET